MVIMLSSPEAFIEWKKSISHFSLYMVIQDLSEILIALPMQQKKRVHIRMNLLVLSDYVRYYINFTFPFSMHGRIGHYIQF